jgi:hypothetical protein
MSLSADRPKGAVIAYLGFLVLDFRSLEDWTSVFIFVSLKR